MSKALKNMAPESKVEGNPGDGELTTRQKEILETLRQSPVFKMSLHSKELFHSNFLAWLGEDPELREVFRNVMVAIGLSPEYLKSWGDDYEILREKEHFDLLVKAPDIKEYRKKLQQGKYYVVIENKIKSIPSKKQLQNYSEKLPKDNPELRKILLSIGTHDGELPDDWKQVTYSQIIDGLKMPVLGEISPYKRELIRDYTLMLECLVEIISTVTVSLDESYLTDDKTNRLRMELDKLRIADLYDKWRASKIAALVSKELGVPCYFGYTNKTPFIEVQEILRGKKEDKYAWIGTIQIQGAQYRRCIWGPFKSEQLAEEYPGFMYPKKGDFEKALKSEYPNVFAGTKMRGDYCCYGVKDDSPFWYQYVVISPDTKISSIIDCLRKDLEKLKGFKKEEDGKTQE